MKQAINRFFYILDVFFDRHGFMISGAYGVVFFLAFIFTIPMIAVFILIDIYIYYSGIAFVLLYIIFYFRFLYKKKFLDIIENQKPIKFYEAIFTIVIVALCFLSLFLTPE